ncbi:MAG: ACT domain-containing protein [Candidatus Thorarchaeota archaeon]
MTGINDLSELLASMEPTKLQEGLVFCTLEWENLPTEPIDPLMLFKEKEGFTVIISEAKARSLDLNYDEVWSWIELSVHSSLSAVGFIAAVSKILAENNISVNVVSAFHHDHLFVKQSDDKRAMKLLQELSQSYRS